MNPPSLCCDWQMKTALLVGRFLKSPNLYQKFCLKNRQIQKLTDQYYSFEEEKTSISQRLSASVVTLFVSWFLSSDWEGFCEFHNLKKAKKFDQIKIFVILALKRGVEAGRTNYRSTSQIWFKSFPITTNISQIHRWSWKIMVINFSNFSCLSGN